MIGTVIGAVAIVVLTACFPQDRASAFSSAWRSGAPHALSSPRCCTISRPMRRRWPAITAAIIASDQLGATGGANGEVFMLAVTRASEICIGIVCAGIVLAGTDFGGAPRRLAALFAALSAEITAPICRHLGDWPGRKPRRRSRRGANLFGRVIALDPVIDEALGESSQLRYHSPVLQRAVDGLFAALAGWRTVAVSPRRGCRMTRREREADAVLQSLPQELRGAGAEAEPTRWLADPVRLRRTCEAAVRALIALPAATPSLRLLADQTAEVLAGISDALNGLALLVDDPARPVPRRRGVSGSACPIGCRLSSMRGAPSSPSAPSCCSGSSPHGRTAPSAITFAAIGVILFAPRADQAYAMRDGLHDRHRP